MDELKKLTVEKLAEIAKSENIKTTTKMKKDEIIAAIMLGREKYLPEFRTITDGNFKHIYCMSDIHIRPLERHDEFAAVFARVYDRIGMTAKDSNLIIIAGDIFEKKDDLKPESILLARDFFVQLAELGTLLVVAGNHDMLENNTRRIDQITAVMDRLGSADLHYLKETAVYDVGNLHIVVSSLLDKKFIRHCDYVESLRGGCLPAKKTVAVYHGTLAGAKNDMGFEIEDTSEGSTRFRKKSEFAGYDMTLLGDIHMHQFLSPRIAYCGSLIQQNFGEGLRHGMLHCDVGDGTMEFVEIKNDYSFVKIDVDADGGYEMPCELTPNVYLRLDMKCGRERGDKILAEIKKSANILSMKTKIEGKALKAAKKAVEFDEMPAIARVAKKYGFDPAAMEKTHAEFRELLSPEMTHSCDWRILRIKFRNLFMYSGPNEINFDEITGKITGIISPNATGKTTLIYIIIFILFNGSIRGTRLELAQVVTKGEKSFEAECEFMFGEVHYRVRKAGIMQKDNIQQKVVVLEKFVGGAWQNLSGTKTTETMGQLSRMLDAENFPIKNILSRTITASLFTCGAKERHEIISRIFGLEMYAKLEELAKTKIAAIDSAIQNLRMKLAGDSTSLGRLRDEIAKYNLAEMRAEKETHITFAAKVREEIAAIETELAEFAERRVELAAILGKDDGQWSEGLADKLRQLRAALGKAQDKISTDDYYNLKSELKSAKWMNKNKYSGIERDENALLEERELRMREKESMCIMPLNSAKIKWQMTDEECAAAMATNEVDLAKLALRLGELRRIRQRKYVFDVVEVELPANFDFDACAGFLMRGVDMPKYLPNNPFVGVGVDELNAMRKEINVADIRRQIADLTKFRPKNYKSAVTRVELPPKFDYYANAAKISGKYVKVLAMAETPYLDMSAEELAAEKRGIKIVAIGAGEDLAALETLREKKGAECVAAIGLFSSISAKDIDEIAAELNAGKVSERAKNLVRDSKKMLSGAKIADKLRGEISEIDVRIYRERERLAKVAENEAARRKLSLIDNALAIAAAKEYEAAESADYTYCLEIEAKKKELEMTAAKLEERMAFINDALAIAAAKKYGEMECLHYSYCLKCSKEAAAIEGEVMNGERRECAINLAAAKNNTRLREIELRLGELANLLYDVECGKIAAEYAAKMTEFNKMNDSITYWKSMDEIERIERILEDRKNKQVLIDELAKLVSRQENAARMLAARRTILDDRERKIMLLATQIDLAENLAAKIAELAVVVDAAESELSKMVAEKKIYDNYRTLIGPKCIPAEIALAKLQQIEEYVNEMLARFVKFTISAKLKNDSEITFGVFVGGNEFSINLLSGYETIALNIIMKSALNRFSYNSKSALFIIDEGLDSIDGENILRFPDLLNVIAEDHSQIIIITHLDIERFIEQKICIQSDKLRSKFAGFV